jgi:hypothetical protein
MASENHNHGTAGQVADWIDDLAGHAHSADAIAALGDAAIPGLREYLARGPQAVPQARCFAVAMLARLPARAATEVLREVLRTHPLKSLAPPFAESEYVVKSDALVALGARTYREHFDDIIFGLHERLRVAVEAAGRWHVTSAIGPLLDFLEDDVLAAAAVDALTAMQETSCDAIVTNLDAWCEEAALSSRRRLALIRAMRVLHGCGRFVDTGVLRHLLAAQHPAVRAAAALLVRPTDRDTAMIESLLHGALGFDRELAGDCRMVLEQAGGNLCQPARQALQRNAEPDLYGQLHTLTSAQRDWLLRYLEASEKAHHE